MGGFYSLVDSTFGRVGLTSPYRLIGAGSLLTGYLSYSTGSKVSPISSMVGTAMIGGVGLLGYALVYPWVQREVLIPLFFKKDQEHKGVVFYSPRALSSLATRIVGQRYGGACLGYNRDGKLAIVTDRPVEQLSSNYLDYLIRHEKVHADQGIIEPFDLFYTFSPKLRAFAELEAYSVARYGQKASEAELRSIYTNRVSDSIYGNVTEYEDEAVRWMQGRYAGTAPPIKTLRWKIL